MPQVKGCSASSARIVGILIEGKISSKAPFTRAKLV